MRVKLPAVPRSVPAATAANAAKPEVAQAVAAPEDVFVQARKAPVALAGLEGPPKPVEPSPAEQLATLTTTLRQLGTAKVGILGQLATLTARLPAATGAAEVSRLSAEVNVLQGQLANVEVQIKQVLQQLEALRRQEEQARPDPAPDQIMGNLEKAAEAYDQILDATDLK
jgi:hypothetical protein